MASKRLKKIVERPVMHSTIPNLSRSSTGLERPLKILLAEMKNMRQLRFGKKDIKTAADKREGEERRRLENERLWAMERDSRRVSLVGGGTQVAAVRPPRDDE